MMTYVNIQDVNRMNIVDNIKLLYVFVLCYIIYRILLDMYKYLYISIYIYTYSLINLNPKITNTYKNT